MRWNLQASGDWKPLFNRNFPSPGLPSIQPPELVMTSSDSKAAKQLKERLERTLR